LRYSDAIRDPSWIRTARMFVFMIPPELGSGSGI
jgi:hypothetical protein